MSNFAKDLANLTKMMAKVDETGGAFCDFTRHAATMVVVMSGLSYNLHRFGKQVIKHGHDTSKMNGVLKKAERGVKHGLGF